MATILTNVGKGVIVDRMRNSGTAEPVYIGWGTGAGTAAVTDTTLFTESPDESRTTGTSSKVTTTTTDDTWRLTGTIVVATNNKTISNAGCLTASSGGTLFIKGDFSGVALVVGESIAFTIDAKFA